MFVHPAALMMALIGVPLSLAADVLADRVLCAVNTLVSMPVRASVTFSHREMVAAVCGARSVTNRFGQSPLSLRVRFRYSCKTQTTHRDSLVLKLYSSIGA